MHAHRLNNYIVYQMMTYSVLSFNIHYCLFFLPQERLANRLAIASYIYFNVVQRDDVSQNTVHHTKYSSPYPSS